MLDILKARFQQKYRTLRYPYGPPPPLPERMAGKPLIQPRKKCSACEICVEVCPTDAISRSNNESVSIDMGRCIFCLACSESCPEKAIAFTGEYRLAGTNRDDLSVTSNSEERPVATCNSLFKRSLKLRQVSAGGCNACEADSNVLGTPAWDFARFGIQFVASPRHADGLLVTGPVTKNMQLALLKTYEAVPDPKIVIAVGACAISGGPYIDHDEVCNGVYGSLPVDLFIPGCPPHPLTILDGLLSLLGVKARV